jgi:phage terminase large subunit-like protein
VAGKTYIDPQPGKQYQFLESAVDVCWYGGSAFCAKSFSLLMASCREIFDPRYTAIIFRRESTSITTGGGLWDTGQIIYRANNYRGHPIKSKLTFSFPSGAKIRFSHLEYEADIYKHHGGQYAFIGFDELGEFTKKQFMYIMTRNRGMTGYMGDCFVRATMNPDADHWTREIIDYWIGEDGYPIPERCGVIKWFTIQDDEWLWVDKDWKRVLPDGTVIHAKSFTFIGATISDNPLGRKANPDYESTLYAQDEVTRERLLKGNWNITYKGKMFNPAWFKIEDHGAPASSKRCRYYDMAATQSEEKQTGEPASTAGALVVNFSGDIWIEDIVDWMETPGVVEENMKMVAALDGPDVMISWEEEKGSSGRYVSQNLHTKIFAGYECRPDPVSGDKVSRAKPLAALAEHGHVHLVKGDWNRKFLAQAGSFFTKGKKCDEIDATTGAVKMLTQAVRVWPWYSNKSYVPLDIQWKTIKKEDVVIIVHLVGDGKYGVYGVFCMWGRKSRALYVYNEIVQPNPIIDILAREIREKAMVPLISASSAAVHKVFVNEKMATGGDDMRKLLLKQQIRTQINHRYDDVGSVTLINSMFNQGTIYVAKECIESDRQFKEWGLDAGRPDEGYPLCRALCGVVTELREHWELAEPEELKAYSKKKQAIREKLKRGKLIMREKALDS